MAFPPAEECRPRADVADDQPSIAALTAAQQVAQDLAEFLAHQERPSSEWFEVRPTGEAQGLVAGYEVLPHVQLFADRVREATTVQTIGTYPGHSPSLERALDLFVSVNSTTVGNAICQFAFDNLARFGVRYLIYRQRIWHRLDPVWRWMADRGDLTQNHFDHVHISFETEAAGPGDEPPPDPPPYEPEEIEVSKIAYPLQVDAGERRRLPIVAIGGGFGWTKASVTFASTGVEVRRAVVGPNERPIDHLSPDTGSSSKVFDGRWYVDLRAGDEWIEVELGAGEGAGTLDLYVEAADG